MKQRMPSSGVMIDTLEPRRLFAAAPLTLQGLTLTFTISQGATPAGGIYTFNPSATNQATYSIDGTGDLPNSTGNYFYNPQGNNTAILTTSDPGAPYEVTTLSFDASGRNGTYRTEAAGGIETGTFAITQRTAASIVGVVYDDRDGNFGRNGTEPPVAMAQVYLDLNRNGFFDSSEPTSLTGNNGNYSFTGLQPGTYVVRQVVPGTMRGTQGLHGTTVNVANDRVAANINMGRTSRSFISGKIYDDANASGTLNANERGVAGAKVYLDIDRDGAWDFGENYTYTNAQGLYFLNAPPSGEYAVRAVAPIGYDLVSNNAHSATLTAGGKVVGRNFAMQTNGQLTSFSVTSATDDEPLPTLAASLLSNPGGLL